MEFTLKKGNGDRKEKKMKRSKCLMIILAWLCVSVSLVFPVWGLSPQPEPPDIKTITLSKGTEVKKVGPGHFKFKLPDGKLLEVKGLARSSGEAIAIFKECKIFDPKGQLIASGIQGALKGSVKPADQSKVGIIGDSGSKTGIIGDSGSKAGIIGDSGNFVKIDDDVIWLPATITFKLVKMKRKP